VPNDDATVQPVYIVSVISSQASVTSMELCLEHI